VSSGARLAELCAEDKAKIGELVKKLALESKQKQEFAQRYEQEKAEMARRLQQLEEQSVLYEDERDQMRDKFSQSLQMLRQLKDEQLRVERDQARREEELQKVKEELERREAELQRQKTLVEIEREEKAKLHVSSASVATDVQASSTLKEISDLKNEIVKLTTSLKRLKSPDSSSEKKPRKSERREERPQRSTSVMTASLEREDLQAMKIDELHALQEELAKKLEITNSLLQSKLTNSHKKCQPVRLKGERDGS